MKKRSRAGGEPIKGRRRKAPKPKGRNAPKAVARSIPSPTNEETEVARLTRELSEARDQQTATSDVLQVISSFAGELDPVFQAILANATRICEAKFGALYLKVDDGFRATAMHNAPPAYEEARAGIVHPPPSTSLWRAANTKQAVQKVDVTLEPGYIERDPFVVSTVALGGFRSVLSVPMLHEDKLVGVITIFRQEVRPFTDKQIDLVKNFAAQAVIAIENARLLNELRQRTTDLTERTADLTEALEQQTATSEVLQVISTSPGDLEPVFATMLEKAVRLGEAAFGNIYRWNGETGHLVATYNTPRAFAQERRSAPDWRPAPESPVGRLLTTKSVVHVTDLASERAYVEKLDAVTIAGVELGDVRTVLFVPMLKERELMGYFGIARQEVRPFTDKQIELVQNFAAQAVIAIENARLLNELRQSLEQQTATADVLQVISSSLGDLEPVFATMLEQAVRICEASVGSMVLRDGDMFRRVAIHGAPLEFVDFHESRPTLHVSDAFALGQILRTKQVVQIGDVQAEEPETPIAKYGGARTLLTVPLLKENEVIGALGIYRQEVRLFSDKQIALVENFAAQAVIAIENNRLLNELRQRTTDLTESLDQQTATSEVLSVISRSPGELHLVFETILQNAVRICGAKFGNLWLREGDFLRIGATHGAPAEWSEFLRREPVCRVDPRLGRPARLHCHEAALSGSRHRRRTDVRGQNAHSDDRTRACSELD